MMQAEMKVRLDEETISQINQQVFIATQKAMDQMNQSTEKLFYTQNEVMEILRCGREQMFTHYAQGLKSVKQGRTVLIQKAHLIEYMNKLAK